MCAAIAVLALAIDGSAQAQCLLAPPAVIWSYPVDGQTDVPTNAHIFVMTTLGSAVTTITVNGQPTTRPSDGRFGEVAQLQPNAPYEVAMQVTAADGTAASVGFSFTTGAGPAPEGPPPAPSIGHISALKTRTLSPVCTNVWQSMDCFDTGQDTHIVYETGVKPLLFFVQPRDQGSVPWTMTWPAECGDPEIYVAERCSGTQRVYAVSVTGEASTADADCAAAVPPASPSHGCSVARAPRGSQASAAFVAVAGFACAAGFARRRRRSRADHSASTRSEPRTTP